MKQCDKNMRPARPATIANYPVFTLTFSLWCCVIQNNHVWGPTKNAQSQATAAIDQMWDENPKTVVCPEVYFQSW